MTEQELKQHFEANMLDGDEIQERGQMLSSASVFEYIKDLVLGQEE